MKREIQYSTEQGALINHAKTSGENFAGDAVAGSGKSQVGCAIVSETPKTSWIYIQFMKKGQREMERRISDNRGESITFNALCNRQLTSHWGFCQAKSFWAEANRVNSIDSACKSVPLNQVTKLIGALKCEFPFVPTIEQAMKIALKYGIEDCVKHKYPLEEIVSLAVKALPLALVRSIGKFRQVSWEDQTWVPVVNGWLRPVADLTLCDEAQDLNPVQHEAFTMLCKGVQAGVLGDARQQIYGWRGAVDNGLASIIERIGARVYPMTESFRCPQVVATKVREIVPHFTAHPSNPQGEINTRGYEEGTKLAKYGDAWLSRTNAPLMPLCLSFIKRGITSRIEGKDIGYALDAVVKQVGGSDIVEFCGNLEAWVQARIAKATGFNAANIVDYVTDQAETLKVLAETCSSVSQVSEKIAYLFEDSDGNEKPSVKCSTVHKAKGLEWSNVSVLQDTFKKRATNASQTREEENVTYVAWTRTLNTLNFVNGTSKTVQP